MLKAVLLSFSLTQKYKKLQYCCRNKTKKPLHFCKGLNFKWSHLGSNQGPPDYESGALTN